jgi:multicomponent Na+:H+ antiporter subunit D
VTVDAVAALLIVLPAAAAVTAFAAGGRSGAPLAIAVSVAQLGLVAALAASVLAHGAQVVQVGGWGAPLGIDLRVDGLGVLLLAAVAVVGAGVTAYAAAYFDAPGSRSAGRAFWPLWLLQLTAFDATFLSGDLFNLYVTLELLTLSAVGMIGLAGEVRALAAAVRYLVVTLAGSLLYLLGVALTYGAYGTVDWGAVAALSQPDAIGRSALALMTVGLIVKTALFPMHFWLPPAHAEAPAPVSAVLSGLVLKASLFILLRVWFFAFPAVTSLRGGQLLAGLGAAAVLWGSIQAVRQHRAKRIIAYSTVAQIGYLFLVFALAEGDAPTLAWRGTLYLAASHACAKAAAFLAVGTLARQVGTDEIAQWRGIAREAPVSVFALGLAGVTLSGLPPSGGFVAKWLLLQSAASDGQWGLALVPLVGGLLAAVYVLRVVEVTLSRPAAEEVRCEPAPAVMRWVPLALALAAIAFGVVTTEPLQLLDIGSPFAGLQEPAW